MELISLEICNFKDEGETEIKYFKSATQRKADAKN